MCAHYLSKSKASIGILFGGINLSNYINHINVTLLAITPGFVTLVRWSWRVLNKPLSKDQGGLKLKTTLVSAPKYWDFRHEKTHQACCNNQQRHLYHSTYGESPSAPAFLYCTMLPPESSETMSSKAGQVDSFLLHTPLTPESLQPL